MEGGFQGGKGQDTRRARQSVTFVRQEFVSTTHHRGHVDGPTVRQKESSKGTTVTALSSWARIPILCGIS